MQQRVLGASGVTVSRLVYGCMRLVGGGQAQGKRAVRAAVDAGFTIFDHADIYADGGCERLFGEVLAESPGLRERLALVSKCGIRGAGSPGAEAPKPAMSTMAPPAPTQRSQPKATPASTATRSVPGPRTSSR